MLSEEKTGLNLSRGCYLLFAKKRIELMLTECVLLIADFALGETLPSYPGSNCKNDVNITPL